MKRVISHLFLLSLLLSSAYACLGFITPLPSDHGREIDEVQHKIQIGSTTRVEIISILGKPDVSKNRFIFYSNKESVGGVLFVLISYAGGGANVYGQEFMDLYFEFDNYGVLVEFRTDKYDKLGSSLKE